MKATVVCEANAMQVKCCLDDTVKRPRLDLAPLSIYDVGQAEVANTSRSALKALDTTVVCLRKQTEALRHAAYLVAANVTPAALMFTLLIFISDNRALFDSEHALLDPESDPLNKKELQIVGSSSSWPGD